MARQGRSKPGYRTIRVVRRPGLVTEGLLRLGPHVFRCALGRTGITRFKREGDGATPAAAMRLLSAYWRGDRHIRPAARLPLRATRPDDGWCDDPHRGPYNRAVRLPSRASHEAMRRDDGVYDVVVVLDWNVRRRALARGSAIFFHLARPDYAPTAGCVAVSAADMRRILGLLAPDAVMVVR